MTCVVWGTYLYCEGDDGRTWRWDGTTWEECDDIWLRGEPPGPDQHE